jgi:hypothetical protein
MNEFAIHLRIFEASFPTNTQNKVFKTNEWITEVPKYLANISAICT